MDSREERLAVLNGAVEAVQTAYDRWQHGDSPRLTQEFSDAMDDLGAVWQTGDLPGETRTLAAQIDALLEKWREFQRRAASFGEESPSQGFWRQYQDTMATREVVECPDFQIEPIDRLVKQQVPDAIICKIYGFLLANGEADLQKLEEEIATPGKHTGPGTGWMHPAKRRWLAEHGRSDEATRRLRERAKTFAERSGNGSAAPGGRKEAPQALQDVNAPGVADSFDPLAIGEQTGELVEAGTDDGGKRRKR